MSRPKKDPKPTSTKVTERSDLAPLPYLPNLKLALRSVTASIVMVYLETHLPPPLPRPGARPSVSSLPVLLSIDKVARDLCISRRTLYVSLCILSSRFKTEQDRASAARANREFYVPQHSRHSPIKLYSMTGSMTFYPGTVLQLRRNPPLVANLLLQARFGDIPDLDRSLVTLQERAPATPQTASTETLKDIMLRASVLRDDMRTNRYERAWAAERRKLVVKGRRQAKTAMLRAVPPPGDASTGLPEGGNGLL